ncbi:MAG: hypothetical protein JSR90_12460 [Proteobacteria bacterium]|nr:hypothetical protein [Pseudomonadota bacterium]
MIRRLPAIAIAATVLATSVIVQGLYALFRLESHALDSAGTAYDWTGAATASALASGMVLLAAALAQGLLMRKAAPVPVPSRAGRVYPRR